MARSFAGSWLANPTGFASQPCYSSAVARVSLERASCDFQKEIAEAVKERAKIAQCSFYGLC